VILTEVRQKEETRRVGKATMRMIGFWSRVGGAEVAGIEERKG